MEIYLLFIILHTKKKKKKKKKKKDGLYVVYGNCIIETEFIDSNNLTFYLPPNPKCFHYNGRKTVKEDLFVVDLYKSLIAHTEFNTNISGNFFFSKHIIIFKILYYFIFFYFILPFFFFFFFFFLIIINIYKYDNYI